MIFDQDKFSGEEKRAYNRRGGNDRRLAIRYGNHNIERRYHPDRRVSTHFYMTQTG